MTSAQPSANLAANLTREETADRAAHLTVHRLRVELDLTGAPDPTRTGFPSTTTLEFDATTDATWIDFIGESVERVTVNGQDQAVRYDGARIEIDGLEATNTVRIEATAAYSRSGEGMHRFVDPVDGETYLYTQYEPADSRRVMACFEQPDMKAAYTFDVTAPAGWEVRSNQSPAETEQAGETQRVVFAPTLPISSYITVVIAGPYARVDSEWAKGEQQIALSVLCRASLAEHLEADEILEITRQGLDFFDEAFAFPYPWGKYDQIFVPEYNLGAMENPGLVTFTEAYIPRGAATDAQRGGRANTILHEMAHMWFGDLVTMRWWDDLWLKESFADYMGSHVSAAATRYTDAWARFANSRKAWAYRQDQLPTTHPIVADIPDLEAAKLNFDGITYAKGASVLKQLVAFVSEEAFFEGARRYFAAHAYGNTTLGDLLDSLEAVSGKDLRAWSRAWLETSGVATLWIERDAQGGSVLVQDGGSAGPRPHQLRVGLYDLRGGELELRERIDVSIHEERTEIDLPEADLVLLNDDDLTYAKVRLDERSLAAVESSLTTLRDDLTRGLVWASLWNATRDGELLVAQFLSIVQQHAPRETNVALLAVILDQAAFAVRNYASETQRDLLQREWLETSWAALQSAAPGSDAQLAWARAFASACAYDSARAADAQALLDGVVPDGLPMDADLRWQVTVALSTRGVIDAEAIAAERAQDATANGRTAEIEALAARPDAAVRAAAWESAWNDLTLSNDHLDATIHGFRAGGRRDLIAGFDEAYFAQIRGAWDSRSIELAKRLVNGLFPATPTTDAADAWIAANEDAPGALVRLVREQRDDLARALRVRALQL